MNEPTQVGSLNQCNTHVISVDFTFIVSKAYCSLFFNYNIYSYSNIKKKSIVDILSNYSYKTFSNQFHSVSIFREYDLLFHQS